MNKQTKTHIEEFFNFSAASLWMGNHIREYSRKNTIWVITQSSIIFKGNLYKCTFSVSNQKEMS